MMDRNRRYSIRHVFILISLVALGLSPVAIELRKIRSDHAIAKSLQEQGVQILFERNRIPGFPSRVTAVSFENHEHDLLPSQLALVAQLNDLVSLNLNGTVMSDQCINELHQCNRVRFLYLSNTNLSDQGLRKLAILPNLTAVHVDGTNVSIECVQEFMSESHAFVYICTLGKLLAIELVLP